MNRKLIISIIDNNNYYMEGLTWVLSAFFKQRNIAVDFIKGPPVGCPVDIIFHAVRYGTTMELCRSIVVNDHQPLYFAIGKRKDFRLARLRQGADKHALLYRHQPVEAVLQIIEQAILLHRGFQPKAPACWSPPAQQSLTLREREVLSYLEQGKTPAETASCMNITIKTISSHKRAAMKKLNFNRNNELFHWMLQGGLSTQ